MPDLQPGETNVFFEVRFDKLASSSVRAAITAASFVLIDQLVPPATRATWLNRPYPGDGSPVSTLDYVEKLFNTVNANLVPKPSPKQDSYCLLDSTYICYSTFSLENSGIPVALTVQSNGFEVSCEIIVVMATLP